MKKLLIGLALSLSCLATTSVMAATPAFSTQKVAQTKIPNLSFKQVMRALYMDKIYRGATFVNNDDIEAMPHIALDQMEGQYRVVAAMHPVIAYPSSNGEPRYLVIIEKVLVYDDVGDLNACHACQATADLYSFKRLKNGEFQLVSKSVPDIKLSSTWGRLQFDADEFKEGVEPLGKDLVGSIFQNGYASFGESQSWWEALHLPENDYINIYRLGDAGGSNGGQREEDSPLSYSYDVSYRIIPNGRKYYPILMRFKGDKPTDDYDDIKYVNYSVTKTFDPVKKEYQ